MNKNPLAAFFLSLIPGAGFAYLGRAFRTIFYGGAFFGSLMIAFLLAVSNSNDEEFIIFFLFVAAIAWGINMIDMIFMIVSGKALGLQGQGGVSGPNGAYPEFLAGHVSISLEQQREKSRTIMMSIVPGLGHMGLGLMQRGITLLISFIGLFAIIVFLSSIMNTGALLIFLLALPIIWIYGMFDAIQLLQAKHRGEQLIDRAIFEDLESHISSGRKNKVFAIALSIFPGAGHLYLGLQKRGLQLMGGFLLAIYIMDNLRLSLFFFLLPLFWCFAFFDALQQVSRYERNELSDEPIVQQFVPYQRWFGIAMIGFGIYYLLNRVVSDLIGRYFGKFYEAYMSVIYVIPTVIVSFVLIFLGLRLTFGQTGSAKKAAPPAYPRKEEGIK